MTASVLPSLTVECLANPAANRMTPYGARRSEILGADALALALCHARSSTSQLPQTKPERETI